MCILDIFTIYIYIYIYIYICVCVCVKFLVWERNEDSCYMEFVGQDDALDDDNDDIRVNINTGSDNGNEKKNNIHCSGGLI